MTPTRQPGRRAIIVGSIMGLCITLIWAATFRVIYLDTHPLGAWEQSTCRDTTPDTSATQAADDVLVGVRASVPYGYRASASTREIVCVLRSSDGALTRRFMLPYPQHLTPTFGQPKAIIRQARDVLYIMITGYMCAIQSKDGHQLWCRALQNTNLNSELVVASDVVIVKTQGALEALDAASGAPLWQDNLNDTFYLQGVQQQTFVASADTIYVGHHDPPSNDAVPPNRTLVFCSRAARTGAQNWCQPLAMGDAQVAGVVAGGGSVFVYLLSQSAPSLIYALRASDGKLLWQRSLDCAGNSAPLMAYSVDSAAVGNDSLLIATPQCQPLVGGKPPFQGDIVTLRPADGAIQWQKTTSSLFDMIVANGVIYTDTGEYASGQNTATSSDIRALRLSDASQVWRAHISSVATRLTLSGDTLYAVEAQSAYGTSALPVSLVALRRTDGSERWQATSCGGLVDPLIWHGRLLGHRQGAPIWCHWPATNTYNIALDPVLP